jgi:NMT1/THI5 like
MSRRAFVGAAGMAALARPVAAAEPLIFDCVAANSVHWIAGAAVEQGFFENVGFDAEIGVIQSSPRSMQMLITGAYQISSTQPESAIAAIERGASTLAVIAAPMNRADWVLAGAKGIRSLADLKGNVIGVSSLRISEVWLTTQLLERAGLNKDEVSFIGVGSSPLKITAPQKGSVAAAVLFRPSADRALNEGCAESGAVCIIVTCATTRRCSTGRQDPGCQKRRRPARRQGDPGRPSLAVGHPEQGCRDRDSRQIHQPRTADLRGGLRQPFRPGEYLFRDRRDFAHGPEESVGRRCRGRRRL